MAGSAFSAEDKLQKIMKMLTMPNFFWIEGVKEKFETVTKFQSPITQRCMNQGDATHSGTIS